MSKKDKLFLIAVNVLLFVLMIYPIFLGGIIGGYDPGFHMARIHALATNLASGHFPNPIGFEYLNGFGYGVGFFYGNFFLYPFAVLDLLGLSAYRAYILCLMTFVLANIISINLVVHKLFHNAWATIISGPLYLGSFYFFQVIYIRAAAGELMAFAIIPWILLGLFKLLQGESKYWLVLGISFSALLVTHILSFLILLVTAAILVLLNFVTLVKNKTIWQSFLKAGILALGLSSFFLFSFIQQYIAQPYVSTAVDQYGNKLIILYSIWMKNHFFDATIFSSMNGPVLFWGLMVSLVYYLIKNHGLYFQNKIIMQSFIIVFLFGSLILSPNLLQVAVHHFKPMILLQSITRVNVVILPLSVFIIANCFGQLMTKLPKYHHQIITGLMAGLILLSIMVPIKQNLHDVEARKGPIADWSISLGEYEPKAFMKYNTDHNFQISPKSLEKSEGFKITENNHHHAVVSISDNQGERVMMLPRIYYRGLQVKTFYNGKKIQNSAISKNGLAAVKLPADFESGQVEIQYSSTVLARLGWLISLCTLVLLMVIVLRKISIPKVE
ncbi:hypothetical protein [Companilactobacillus sp.]|uniref:hypothetical protein n=1 Tax=Companilactobacillus sp. TaxID=2767905 RepID=UPI0025B85A95|nr:hypothetical protein [Companilactobacillus sp.]MCH4009292.1 hypothetical protein [Companilactobacillus sp.]MCH4050529.1 hypothetical protein [Companilactobacillus sp.]MCH4077234.1 hypothetical protein [Companilactobacillus sp.]MCH4125810.1 hypothetical protein [Companilactobacillus sp.]MCI1311519.1 hypothetical protein [Companilactobacillus sp.]